MKEDYLNPQSLILFLATELKLFMAINRMNNRRWTRMRVANYISGSEDISGRVSNSTLGRFLNLDHPQKPDPATIRMVAEFLLLMGQISNREIEFQSSSNSIKAGTSLVHFFQIQETESHKIFLQELQGSYINYKSSPPYLLKARLILSYEMNSNSLIAEEMLCLYRPTNLQKLVPMTRNFEAQQTNKIVSKFAGKPLYESRMEGVTLASSEIIFILLNGENYTIPSVLNIHALCIDHDDEVIALDINRNNGWHYRNHGEFVAAEIISEATPARTAVRNLTKTLSFKRSDLVDKFRNDTAGKEAQMVEYKDDELHQFLNTTQARGDVSDEYVKNLVFEEKYENLPSLEAQLSLAYEYGEFRHFKLAIENGANPNIQSPFGDPAEAEQIIFEIARHGRLEWGEVIVNSGRYRPQRDKNGMTPGYYAALTANRSENFGVPEDELYRLRNLRNILLEVELRYASAIGVTHSMEP